MSATTSTNLPSKASTLKIIEVLSVVFSLIYTWTYIQGHSWCFIFGGLGALGFVYLCWLKRIYAESALQLFYVGFAIYGYLNTSDEWLVLHHSWLDNMPYLLTSILGTALLGFGLKRFTNAAAPYLDAFTTVFSLVATVLMVNFIHENWLYWMVIDAVSALLYLKRKLYFGAVLFVLYFFLAIYGFING